MHGLVNLGNCCSIHLSYGAIVTILRAAVSETADRFSIRPLPAKWQISAITVICNLGDHQQVFAVSQASRVVIA
jgi:hypothetical protein